MSEEKQIYEVAGRPLSAGQRALVVALTVRRQEIVAAANAQIAEINAAEAELADMIRRLADLPEGAYKFTGDEREVRLVREVDSSQ